MALIPCPECGRQVSTLASNCPNCGCPQAAASLAKAVEPERAVQAIEHIPEEDDPWPPEFKLYFL